MVREATGYDVTDPWLSDDNMETLSVLRCGSLAVITGSEDLCAFLGASPHKDGFMLVRHLRSLKLMSVPSDALVSIPSPPPRPGDKAVFMGLNDRKLNGWPCSCGPIGQPKSNPSGSSDPSDEKQGNWFWAIYMRQDTRSNTLQNTEMLLVHESNLAVLPSAPGRVHSSLDDSVPRQLLQPLACSVEEENALLFAQNQVRVMLACAGPHPGHEVVALKELRQELENSGRLQGDSTSCSLVATVSAQSAIEDERDQEQRVKDEFFLHMQEVRRRLELSFLSPWKLVNLQLMLTDSFLQSKGQLEMTRESPKQQQNERMPRSELQSCQRLKQSLPRPKPRQRPSQKPVAWQNPRQKQEPKWKPKTL
ncbi:Protein URA2 [Durusdinium trenchii]|uniref:Protein URA2 n=1 Tax=Durusdinium trenchii TaxID=1381693 RepID=A0ABP0JTM7_9DINO